MARIIIKKSFLQPAVSGVRPVMKEPRGVAQSITMAEEIPYLNRNGKNQILPDGSRQPAAECRLIAQQVILVNGMST